MLKGAEAVSDMVGIVRSAEFYEGSEEFLVFGYHLFYLVFIHHIVAPFGVKEKKIQGAGFLPESIQLTVKLVEPKAGQGRRTLML